MVNDNVARASQEWKSALIDVSGTNRLLHFKPTSTTLDLSSATERGLLRLFRGDGVSVRDLYADRTAADHAARAAAALHRKQREATEEYGVSVTYLALGFATWDPESNRALAEAEADELGEEVPARVRRGPSPNAPVLLRPVEVIRRRGVTDDWEIKLVDDFQVNGVLLHVVNSDRPRILEEKLLEPTADFETATITPGINTTLQGVLDAVRSGCADIAGFAAHGNMVIGTFSYQKQPMVNDVANLAALTRSDLAAALAGDVEAAARVRAAASHIAVTEADPDYAPVDSEYLVLDADASQSYVVNAALAGKNLVVQGPPGTGKSQTIANVIAALVADGKHVLFVAQKRAAITAVLDRLQGADLSHLLLDLFAADGSRRVIAEQLRTVLDRQQQIGEPDTSYLHARLTSSRDRLVRHNDALFAPTHGWGASIHELRVASLGFPPEAQTPLRLNPATFNGWKLDTLGSAQTDIDELGRLGALDPEWNTHPGWSPAAMTSADEAERLRQLALDLRWTTLPALTHQFSEAAALSGHSAPRGIQESDALTAMHHDAARVAAVSAELLNGADLDAMLAGVSKPHRREMTGMTWSRRREGKKALARLMPGTSARDRVNLLLIARAVRTAWQNTPVTPYFAAETMVSAYGEARESIAHIDRALQGVSLASMNFDAAASALDTVLADTRTGQMMRAHGLEQNLVRLGLGPVVALLRARAATRELGLARPSEVLRWVCVRSVLEAAELANPAIAGVRGDVLSDATAAFQQLDSSHLQANAARVRRKAAVYLKHAFDTFPDQHSALKTEVTRKRNFRPVRRLFDEVPDVLLAAKPVWAMSPLQVSRILPAAQCFDVVIFDEASQVKPADAIPALVRGRQAIVAGDSRQLPPTEFFTKVLEDEEEPEDDAPLESTDEVLPAKPATRPRSSYTRDAESVLFAMDRLLAGQSRSLQWHYRSYDERLIAVSNKHVYDGSLTTFPAPDALKSIRHEVVPYSPGISGGTNSPELEVRRIVELVREQVTAHPGESVGIIAFGIKHEARIERALELAMQEDAAFERSLNANRDEPWFVKAIERVQGDERDAIILSVGYGKSADGRLRYFWGPLLKEGGERRLNVAISRAKRRMTLVTSFSKDDVPADGHPSAGYRLMFNFVRFMDSGGRDLADGTARTVGLNPFEIDIKRRLEDAGLALDCQVGVAGYRLDFAVRHPDFPGRHVLAIEADGAAYHSGHTARERDRLRQELLERRGWTFHRIWSTDWFNNADREVKRAVAAYEETLRRGDTPNPHSAPTPLKVWNEGTTERKRARPRFERREQITDYSMSTLIELVRFVRSDDVLRSKEDEQRLLLNELGYSRLGSRIQAVLSRAQELA
ncbi:AAA domain-containing protein [Microbacterium sp. Marseille-Q6648]|uniref:AAA domain-containing protein n=1 Tax=Microbacterium sp. Marseille-Q6648 TaxID=2937991 RepID=UPI00203D87E7|nr:AAA domain-containing protein [Microbacterium sp. Marseille-Q6648]